MPQTVRQIFNRFKFGERFAPPECAQTQAPLAKGKNGKRRRGLAQEAVAALPHELPQTRRRKAGRVCVMMAEIFLVLVQLAARISQAGGLAEDSRGLAFEQQ